MRRKVLKSCFITSALIISSLTIPFTSTANAKTTSEKMMERKHTIDLQIQKYNQEIEDLKSNLKENEIEFKETKEEINDLEFDIQVKSKRIKQRSEIIENRMIAYQERDSAISPYMEAVLGAESLTNLLSRAFSVSKIVEADRQLMTSQQEDKVALEERQNELAEHREKLREQFQSMQNQERDLEVKRAENKAKSLKLKEQIASQKEKEKLEKLRKKREAEAKRLKELAEKEFVSQQHSAVGDSFGAGNGDNGAKVTDDDQVAPTISGKGKAQTIISEASKYLGTDYVWGGDTPSSGFDCSGLTQWSYKKAGISIPRTAAQQYLSATKISESEAVAGDLVFFSYGNGVAHVGIYLGGNRMLDSQNNGVVVESLDWWRQYLVGFGKY